jgi:hypothetical protein
MEGMGMATATINGALVLEVPVQLLGPGSEYDRRRILLKKDVDQLVLDAKKVTAVTSAEEEENANNAGRVLQAEGKEIENFYTPLKRQVDSFKAPLLAHEKELALPVDAEKKRLGGLLTTYNQEIERKRQEEERKAREEADRVAREEQLARAVELEAAGDLESAEAVLEEPVFSPTIIQSVATLKPAGQVGKTVYLAKVLDFNKLLKAVMDGKAPRQCITVDQGYLDGKARLDKDGFDVPGVQLVKTAGTFFRA